MFGRSTRDLVANAVYLSKHTSCLTDIGTPELHFSFVREKSARLIPIYVIDLTVQPSPVRKHRNMAGNPFKVLINEYETDICRGGTERAAKFFRECLLRSGVSPFIDVPRFTTVPILVRGGQVSLEWGFLHNQDVVNLLRAVRLFCETYGIRLELETALQKLEVPCLDGMTRALSLLAMPTAALKRKCPHLDLPEYRNRV